MIPYGWSISRALPGPSAPSRLPSLGTFLTSHFLDSSTIHLRLSSLLIHPLLSCPHSLHNSSATTFALIRVATMGRTKQIQKTQTAKTVTHTAISQKQSLQAVQTLIHGGVRLCLSFLQARADNETVAQLCDVPQVDQSCAVPHHELLITTIGSCSPRKPLIVDSTKWVLSRLTKTMRMASFPRTRNAPPNPPPSFNSCVAIGADVWTPFLIGW